MKKALLLILIVCLILLNIVVIFKGITIAGIEIPGIQVIKAKSLNLDDAISVTKKMNETTFEMKVAELNKAVQAFNKEKTNYQAIKEATGSGSAVVKQQYPIEYLWITLGDYAKQYKLKTSFEVLQNTEITTNKDLKVTMTGDYSGIVQFLYDIERDSKLEFVIDNIEMKPSGDFVTAVFTITNLTINM